jgi:hypothetical protein
MYKKINNKTLGIVFAVLLVLVVILFSSKGGHKERSFSKQLVDINTEEITQITITPRSMEGESFDLIKESDEWKISANNQFYKPSSNTVESMLSAIENMIAKSMVANSKDRWDIYEVSDSLASRVQLFKGSKKVGDVFIGKFKFSQPRSMSTYVRLEGGKETYKVDGFLTSTFNRKVNDLRDKTVIDDPLATWNEIAFSYPSDSSFVLSKVNNRWMLDGGIADSTEVANYINSIKQKSANSISENSSGSSLLKIDILRSEGEPIELLVKNSDNERILISSENENVRYNDQNTIDQIFVSRKKFEIKP